MKPFTVILLWIYTQQSQRNRAANEFKECVRLLEDEYEMEPSNETIRLHKAIKQDRISLLAEFLDSEIKLKHGDWKCQATLADSSPQR